MHRFHQWNGIWADRIYSWVPHGTIQLRCGVWRGQLHCQHLPNTLIVCTMLLGEFLLGPLFNIKCQLCFAAIENMSVLLQSSQELSECYKWFWLECLKFNSNVASSKGEMVLWIIRGCTILFEMPDFTKTTEFLDSDNRIFCSPHWMMQQRLEICCVCLKVVTKKIVVRFKMTYQIVHCTSGRF